MKGWKKIDQARFDMVHKLVDLGISSGEIKHVCRVSYQTIASIKRSKTLEAYRDRVTELKSKPQTALIPPGFRVVPGPTATAGIQTNGVVLELREINATLKLLVEAWKAKPGREV